MKRERGAVFVDVRGRWPKVWHLVPKRARWPMVGEGPWERGTALALVIFVSGNAAVLCVATTVLAVGGPEGPLELTRPPSAYVQGHAPIQGFSVTMCMFGMNTRVRECICKYHVAYRVDTSRRTS